MDAGRDAPEPPVSPPPRTDLWRAGWGEAARAGAVAFLVTAVAAEALAFVAAAAGGTSIRPALTARVGGVLFFAFHHVALSFGGGGVALFDLSFAVMAGTLLAAAALLVAGRWVARTVGGPGPPWAATVQGAKVAVPYAALCAVAWVLVRVSVVLPPNRMVSSSLAVRPAFVQAVVWPVLLAVVFGAAGGALVADENRRWRAAVAGGLTMAGTGLALAFVGLLVVAAVRAEATAAYLHAIARAGAARGFALILFTLLVVPNLATWILVPAMGSCLRLSTGTISACVLSYGRVPTGAGGALASAAPPFAARPGFYLLFLLVPAVAAVAGGRRAAATASATTRGDGAVAGALAGVVFGGLAILLVLASTVSVGIEGLARAASTPAAFALGPEPVRTVILALAWGVVGGAAGGALRSPSTPGGDDDQEPNPLEAGGEGGPVDVPP